KLVERQQLTLKDLGYAAENARDQRVRQVAVALLLVRLNQVVTEPPSPAGLLHVVSGGRSFAERRQYQLVSLEAALVGAIFGAGMARLVPDLLSSFSTPAKPLQPEATSPIVIAIAILMIVIILALPFLLMAVLDRILKRIDKRIQYHRKGHEGEERVVATMH